MKKLIQRLIIFFVGMPSVLLPIYFFPQFNFLFFHIEILFVGIFATIEIQNILSKRLEISSTPFLVFMGSVMLGINYFLPFAFMPVFFSFSLIILMTFELLRVLKSKDEIYKSVQRISSGIFALVYPWLFLFFLSNLVTLPNAQNSILVFLFMVFFCDSLSWFFGMLLGGNNRGLVSVSPKKSLAGFAGGVTGSIAAGFLGFYVFKTFGNSLPKVILLSLLTCFAAILGDLIESMLKRAGEIKDSGQMVLGRGGLLDSIDSILIAAPVFDISFRLLIGN